MSTAAHTEFFMRQQPRLRALGYRLLGSVSDAEDIVQEAYLRWSKVDPAKLDQPEAYLSRIVTRLCLDHLKSARVRRETYVGPWLPEPLVAESNWTTSSEAGVAHDVSYAFMLLLDRLTAKERAAFVLHDVFGLSFDDIGATLGSSAAACRKLAERARTQLRPSTTTAPALAPAMAEHPTTRVFMEALRNGDLDGLRRSLTEDAVLVSDGGARVRAARRPILGREKIARMFARLSEQNYRPHTLLPMVVNGLPGLVVQTSAGPSGTFAFELEGDRIRRIYVVRNPDKLRHLTRTRHS
jgi:RNA polymerase sigma-70 factor, ECF subfamily